MTPNDLLRFSPGDFLSAQAKWASAAGEVAGTQGTLTGVSGNMSNWTGPASDAANTALDDLANIVGPMANALNDGQDAIQGFVAEAVAAQGDLKTALAQAAAIPASVNLADGTVTANPVVGLDGQPPAPGSGASLFEAQEMARRQAAAQQAQAKIQQAVQRATTADQKGAGELSDGGAAAGQAGSVSLAGGQVISFNLGRLAQAPAWMGQEVNHVAALVQQASTDPATAQQLNQEYGPLARQDNMFATSLLNKLGPGQMESLVTNQAYDNIYDPPDPTTDPFLQFLSMTLASGTAGTGQTGLPSGSAVSQDWLNQLTAVSNKKYGGGGQDKNSVPGYWALSQIMAAATQPGQVPYSTTYLTTVGPAMALWDNQNHQGKDAWDGGYGTGPDVGFQSDTTDPMVGLLTAADTNVAGAQAMLSTHLNGIKVPASDGSPGTVPSNMLTYLIADHHWNQNTYMTGGVDGSDLGGALGHTFELVTEAPGGSPLAVQGINAYGAATKAGGNSYGTSMSAFRSSAGVVLANNIATLDNSTATNGTDLPTNFNTRDLAYALSQVGQDGAGYNTVLQAQLAYGKGYLAQSANQEDPSLSLSGAASRIANGLGFIVGARDAGLNSAAAATQAAALKQQQSMATLINAGIAFNPIPGQLLTAVNTALGETTGSSDLGTLISHALPNGSGAVSSAKDQAAVDDEKVHDLVTQMVQAQALSNPSAYHLGSVPADIQGANPNQQDLQNYMSSGPGEALNSYVYTGINGQQSGYEYVGTLLPSS